MTPLTLWLALANPISDCGCFGDAVVLTNWQTFWKNVVLLVCALVVVRWPRDMFRFVSKANQWIVINYTLLFAIIVSLWSLYYLPPFDFRPYHIGTDLRDGWQRTMEGEDLPYADLFIERADTGDDITEAVLADTSYTFLLVSPYLEQADDSRLDLINQLYEYAHAHHYGFYCLTASTAANIERWTEMTGAEYPFCLTDGTTLKTIVRSNPGLLLMKDGRIIGKWSHNDLPDIDDEQAQRPLERLRIGHMPDDSVAERIMAILLWFVLPLALLVLADRLWTWTTWLRRRRKPHEAQTSH
jgi:triosephosphate isomerase